MLFLLMISIIFEIISFSCHFFIQTYCFTEMYIHIKTFMLQMN